MRSLKTRNLQKELCSNLEYLYIIDIKNACYIENNTSKKLTLNSGNL